MQNKQIKANPKTILDKEFLNPLFLDKFSLNEVASLPKISVVVPTYNRSPYKSANYNPLSWCLEALLAQGGNVLGEIIVVDDASTDYTGEVIKFFQNKSKIPIVYIKNEKNEGSSKSRNIAVEKSKNDYIMFLDDDCIASKYMLFGATLTLSKLGDSAAILQLPVYHRRTMPTMINTEEIGVLDLENGIIKDNFHTFPRNYAENIEEFFLDLHLKILRPIKIKNISGVFLVKKQIFDSVGGFPEFFTWRNGYREETDLALRISEKGYKIFFTPDSKFHCIHLKYGSDDNEEHDEDLAPHLKDLISRSNNYRLDTGNRVNKEEWFYSFLLSTYVTFKKRNPLAAKYFLYETYKNFVVKNKFNGIGIDVKIGDLKKRRKIFYKAVNQGDKLVP